MNMKPRKKQDYLLKVLLIGDSNVGKTKLLLTFLGQESIVQQMPTAANDFLSKTIKINNRKITLQIWNTAGLERFRSVTTTYYRGSMGVILVYDVTNAKTFDSVQMWIKNINENSDDDVVVVLVGNECHKQNKREVTTEQGEEFAAEHNLRFKEVSCKKNINVKEVFHEMAEEIILKLDSTTENTSGPTIRPGQENQEGSSCC
ncbi:ras-related protein Rab-10 isoform X1 [Nematostella vectensis]|uniref:ras-related protein Rab-10 isoform X1 n=1 Tax=Nematostella vectensis TaxID=45351 RepID=UPI002077661C|nr:ras-related protein Rab-10 isoform X1 [Nematostella vectensis]